MINNSNQIQLNAPENNQNRRRLYPQDRQRINNNVNVKYGPIPNPNVIPNSNKFSMNNNNLNINRQNRNIIRNNVNNNEIENAFLIIQRELKKKDNKIAELERKVKELTRTLESLNNINNNFNLTRNIPMTTPFKGEPISKYSNSSNDKQMINNMNNNLYNNAYGNQINIINMDNNNIRNHSQKRSFPVNNLNYNSDNENLIKRYQGYDNLSHSNDNSALTYNGIHTNSKKDVKEYLKEVKEKIEPRKFKEFIRNIKLLTSKSEIAPNKEMILETMRNLFGKEHLDLFLRFEQIIGARK